ncbi:adhesin [Salmonella enterica subsp. enterica serovar Napoli]|uniref:Adhesin n=1 Tax=Salmonella enterica subsp. enterica serovar Napoli TaxID=1151001 RepID=A0A5J2KFH6_SALET|nr:adhesin [Salmonella enterica]ECB1141326.1 adhesin [Salmonella enterica subsp. enterica serovar Napoli]ECG1029675.1 adhesin [Salmonella enterica subsp. salamae]ECL2126668.1 adhesin [Salmonella enterica subsp. enterica serovar Veneziana]ECB3224628.1 adhesin [Salmonella enterica subsp. enterica serovar Napoli]
MTRQFTAIKTTLAAALISCAAMTGAAHAEDSQSYTINLSATVPSDSFQVLPVDAGWIDQTQDMGYDIASSRLQVFEKQFQYKNTAGAIQATLTGNLNSDGKPQLSNGSDVIPLAVTFNNKPVTRTATEVVSASAAQAGGRTALKITQSEEAPLTVSGLFTGSVAMIFEPVVTP